MRGLAEQAVACWRGQPADGAWSVEVRANGGNGVVLRASRPGEEPLAVKLSPIDDRERGRREHDALTALAGTGLAPRPVALVVEPAGAPVTALVTSWVDGVAPEPSWATVRRTAELLTAVHTHAPDGASPPFPAADAISLLHRGKWRLGELPPDVAAPLADTVDRLLARPTPATRRALVHCDPSPANLVGAVLVDWEYAGIGDPALDHAYLCTHPTLLDVCAEHPDRCAELAETLGGNGFALAASVLYWMIIHEILLRTPQPRLAGARQRDPVALREQLSRYRDWFQRLDVR